MYIYIYIYIDIDIYKDKICIYIYIPSNVINKRYDLATVADLDCVAIEAC